MASVTTYAKGLRRIDFVGSEGKRLSVRLGRVSMKQAETFKTRIETIIADKDLNRPPDQETARWLAGLDEGMLSRLRAVGLAEGVGLADISLGDFLKRFLAASSGKPATKVHIGHTSRNLLVKFTAGRMLRTIGPQDADDFKAWLLDKDKEGLSPATAARRIVMARTMWRTACRWRMAETNIFTDIKAGPQHNESRKKYIPAETIEAAIAACPDTEWRVIVSLARYAGLRTPSETFALRWGDVNWSESTINVTSPKTEHIEGHASRLIPLFPEVKPHLLQLFAEAEPGAEYVIAKRRLPCANLRTSFLKILRRAGIQPWAKLFHNLRASAETDLMQKFNLSTVCKWIGNSPAIAAKHYSMSVNLSEDFRRAAGLTEAQQKAQQSAAGSDCNALTTQNGHVVKSPENTGENDFCQTVSTTCETSQNDLMGVAGFEPATSSL
ncbi:MAG: site-specific integrase [Planctomycetes bacterium]|nr:site-specific integrase [Planctomycetota bacterium]